MIVDGEERNAHLAIAQFPGHQLEPEDLARYGLGDRPLKIIVPFGTRDFAGFVAADDDGAVLVWNDFVANDWVELYSTTAVALMRLAALLDGWERDGWFVHDAQEFHREAFAFLHKEAVHGGVSVVR